MIDIASITDVPALCDLLGVLFSQEHEFEPDRQRQLAGLQAIVGHPEVGKILVLRDGLEIIAMVSLLFIPSTALGGRVAILEDMVVDPQHRNNGEGSRLLMAAIAVARASDCLRITLLTDRDNGPAQRFYERHGFIQSSMIPLRLMLELASDTP